MQAMPDLTIQRPCPPSDARGVQSGGEGQRSGNGDTGGVSGAVTGDGMRDSPGEDGGHGCCSSRPAAATTDEESKGGIGGVVRGVMVTCFDGVIGGLVAV